jgi:hypothetical protein
MAFRIRQSADGALEVEVDTATEVQQLLQVVRANGGSAVALLAAGSIAEEPVRRKARRPRGRSGRPRVLRRRSVKADAAPPVSRRGAVDEAALLKILSRGPAKPAALAREVGHARHKITAALRALADQKRVYATGATLNRLWHLGAAAQTSSMASRRVV